ncbi:hypothetical protein ACWOIF_004140 [Vibrio vulnificus]
MSVLIADKVERDKRNHEKMALVIQFLKQETYTDITNLTLLLGYKVRRPVDRLLNKLIALGFITKHVFEFQTGKISIWGITDLGLTQHVRNINEDFRPFEPSKVKLMTLELSKDIKV